MAGSRQGRGRTGSPGFRYALAVLVVVVALSRFLLVPGSVWEQDEALFAAAAFDTNLVEHRPHPPGFPAWVAVAKAARVLPGDPVLGLELASALLSVLTVALLALAWRPAVGDAAALAGSALFAFLPGVWFHSVRAFSTTPALAFLVAAAVVLHRPGGRAAAAAGGLVGLALAIRPILLPIAGLGLVLALWLRRDRVRGWAAAATAGAAATVIPFAILIATTGGLQSFIRACTEHLGGHAGALHLASWSPGSLGIVRAAGGPLPAAVLAVLAVAGVIRTFPGHRERLAWAVLVLGTVLWLLLAHNRTYPRYMVPVFLLLTVPAVSGLLALFGRRLGWALTAGAVVLAAAGSWTAVRDQAVEGFPPLEALEAAANGGAETVVVDVGLSPFGDLANLERWGPRRTVLRNLVASGAVPTGRLPGRLAAVWAEPGRPFWIPAPLNPARAFTCGSAAVAALAQGRYLEAWTGLGGAVVLDPPGLVCGADGTPPVRRIELLLPGLPGRGWFGLVVETRRDAVLTARVEERVLGRWSLAAGENHGAFRAPAVSRGHPWRLTLECPEPIRIRRAWVEDPLIGRGDREIPPRELENGLDGLVWSRGLHDPERFGSAREGRWTGRRATLFLPLAEGSVELALCAPRPRPARVTVTVPPGPARSVTVGPEWTAVVLPVPANHRRAVLVTVANPFVPADEDPRSADRRELGVVIGSVRIVTSRRP